MPETGEIELKNSNERELRFASHIPVIVLQKIALREWYGLKFGNAFLTVAIGVDFEVLSSGFDFVHGDLPIPLLPGVLPCQ